MEGEEGMEPEWRERGGEDGVGGERNMRGMEGEVEPEERRVVTKSKT